MYWILATLFLLVMLAVPRLRPIAVVGCVILGGLLVWGVAQRLRGTDPAQLPERGRPTTPATILQTLPIEQVKVSNLQLTGGGAPFRLTGRVMNESATLRLKSFMLDISRRDCHSDSLDPSGCALLWHVRQWIELSVPPQEERDFAVSIWARGDAPRQLGTLRDTFDVAAASGEAVAPAD
jgi:hypothetical protein